jgi:predicted patatin/cPLA2 family phospholipase
LSPNGEDTQWLALLKASSALPFLYKDGVNLTPWLTTKAANDAIIQSSNTDLVHDMYLDGGLAAPLPVKEAYNRGARDIVVIRTVDENFQVQSEWVNKLKSLVCVSGYCPKTIDYLVQHEQAYQDELDFIANPPSDARITQIFAGDKLRSKLLGSTDSDLRYDHKLGLAAGRAFLQQLLLN